MLRYVFVALCCLIGSSALACSERAINDCPPQVAPAVAPFQGTATITDPIVVVVCHPYWEQLNGSEADRTRWWGPTIRYERTGWSANLPPIRSRCKRFSVRPGTAIATRASCLGGREISTGPMNGVGTYLLGLPKSKRRGIYAS